MDDRERIDGRFERESKDCTDRNGLRVRRRSTEMGGTMMRGWEGMEGWKMEGQAGGKAV